MRQDLLELKQELDALPNEEKRISTVLAYLNMRQETGTLEEMDEGSVADIINLLSPASRRGLTQSVLRDQAQRLRRQSPAPTVMPIGLAACLPTL
jgi:hypothetical protein